MAETETQVASARRMYDARAANYEQSWHPHYSARFIKLLDIRPGSRILDLACGTGLDAFLAAELVGEQGRVTAVDVSEGMLAVAAERQKRDVKLGSRIDFMLYDVTDLDSNPGIPKASFDFILCSNAFVLFQHPEEVVRSWREYLKPGGILAVDAPHEQNFPSGLMMEHVAAQLGLFWPSNRAWVKSKNSFVQVLESRGFVVDKVVELENISGVESPSLSVDQADEQFDRIKAIVLNESATMDGLEGRARSIFREEFAQAAVNGKIEYVDSLYVYIAHRL
ncbi:uncharacterized protein E0L32_011668 [Thyridium curvatum]|uniref:Methyltransferase domain-containing protein n=1 Tax=Thyridium curvatum TaxID=1093900 RepID=A0A507BEM7_9PEZI|nr:uncharacterized protein E0L32_011668 [Thyridium curvatum]TPX18427.1 hypothetical protein E0L32_011668 [Thyridium curvatum]